MQTDSAAEVPDQVRLVRISKSFESGALSKAKEEFEQQRGPDETAPHLEVDGSELERHVLASIFAAATAAEGGVIDARQALLGTLRVAQSTSKTASPAFQELARILPERLIQGGEAGAIPGISLPAEFPFHRPFADSFEQALQEVRRRPGNRRLWGREWITSALLCAKDASLRRFFEEAGTKPADIRDGWHRFLTESGEPRKPEEWSDWWRRAGIRLPDERAVRHGYLAESTAGTDRLGMTSEFRAFARLIADRNVRPPLSIGLLGDWGSGKSFFMESVRKEVQALAGVPGFCSKIVPVWFNAWHYSDANLWASLVPPIFEEALEAMAPSNKPEEARRELRSLIAEAEGAICAAERQHEEALRQLEEDQERRKILAAELTLKGRLSATAKKSLDKALEQVGWKEPIESLVDLQKALSEMGESGQRLHAVARTALGWRAIVYAALAMAVSFLAAAGLAWLGGSLASDQAKPFVETLAALGGTVGSLAAGGVAALVKANRSVGGFASAVEAAIQSFDEAARHSPEIQAKRREVAAIEERLSAARRRLEEMEGRLAGLEPSKRLAAFIQERASAQDYQSHQGIISLVRRDFNRLSELMADWTGNPRERAPGEEPAKMPENVEPAERIVLYIDDLDRCSHEVVVQTLEAIHLLLALDLFVVVVGVDSRWLLRSLERHYDSLLRAGDGQGAAYRITTPHNYLEKIFQVTYALAPMSQGGYETYVDYLTGMDAVEPAAPRRGGPVEDGQTEAPESLLMSSPSTGPAGDRSAVQKGAGPTKLESEPEAGEDDSAIRPLTFSEREQAFLKKLHPLIPTPRIAKRIANTYRLAKARVPYREWPAFDAAAGRHRPVLLLLAILFGSHNEAEALFRRLCEREFPAEVGPLFHQALKLMPEFETLAETVAKVAGDVTLAECQAEAYELARYSLVTGQVWHTWRCPAKEVGKS